jgi:hypothetical protein
MVTVKGKIVEGFFYQVHRRKEKKKDQHRTCDRGNDKGIAGKVNRSQEVKRLNSEKNIQ